LISDLQSSITLLVFFSDASGGSSNLLSDVKPCGGFSGVALSYASGAVSNHDTHHDVSRARVSELLALKWKDVDWENGRLRIERGIVNNGVDDVKTRYARKPVPLDRSLADVLRLWKTQSQFTGPEDWIWASPFMAGEKPYFYGALMGAVSKAAKLAGLEGIGMHTFRHTYRSWLDETGAPMTVQQTLMRHSDIRTTMNIYGCALPETMRAAHGKVVRMVLPSEWTADGLQPAVTH